MADKMMRIAGRNPNNLAKGIRTDIDGILKVKNTSGIPRHLHDKTSENSNGVTLDVSDYATALLQVYGSFEADIQMAVSLAGGYSTINAYDLRKGRFVKTINRPGMYYVGLVGAKNLQARVTNYKSGQLSLVAVPDAYQLDLKTPAKTIKTFQRYGIIEPNKKELLIAVGSNVAKLNSLEVSTTNPEGLYIIVRVDGRIITKLPTLTGGGLQDANIKNIYNSKTKLWDILHYDDDASQYKVAFNLTDIEGDIEVELYNNTNDSSWVSAFAVAETLE